MGKEKSEGCQENKLGKFANGRLKRASSFFDSSRSAPVIRIDPGNFCFRISVSYRGQPNSSTFTRLTRNGDYYGRGCRYAFD